MARQVYFDPYGSALDGYRLGTSDEQSLQKTTRDARATDLQYYNDQRESRLSDYADPYRRQAIQYGADNMRVDNFNRNYEASQIPANLLGVTAPLEQLLARQFGFTQRTETAQPNPQMETARQKMNDQLQVTLDAGVPYSEELKRGVAQQMADYYKVPFDNLMSPGAEQPQQSQTNYYMGDQQVGAMQNPQEQILRFLRNPDVMRMIGLQNQVENQRINQAQQDRMYDYKDQYLDFARGGYGVQPQGGAPAAGAYNPLEGM